MSFYTSLTGLNSATSQLAVTSNNIANVGTTAFKRSRADFGDIFSTSPLQKSSSQIGQGVLIKGVSQEFNQGNISTSGNSLDLAVTGDGFFPLKTSDGLQDIYTRNGAFMLNEQNNVVNAQGMRLMAASVDSSGTADLSNLSALTIPSKTSGEAVTTTEVQLGINLPADARVITEDFDRTDPNTYNESTALTVYDESGQGYLATVYYVKTQNSNLANPENKWQTHYFIGDTEFEPRLQQATNSMGEYLQMNKYGDTRYVAAGSTQKFPMYRYDDNKTREASEAASIMGNAASIASDTGNITFAAGEAIDFKIAVDFPVTSAGPTSYQINLDLTNGQQTSISASEVAKKLAAEINNTLGALTGSDAHYGIKVTVENGAFKIASGTTGDNSSIKIEDVNALGGGGASKLGLVAGTVDVEETAVRGKASEPAILTTAGIQVNSAEKMNTKAAVDFFVQVDGAQGTIRYPGPASNLDPATFAGHMEELINYDANIDTIIDGVQSYVNGAAPTAAGALTLVTAWNTTLSNNSDQTFKTNKLVEAATSAAGASGSTAQDVLDAMENYANLEGKYGEQVYGVTVEYSSAAKKLTFSSPTTGSNSVIEVTPQSEAAVFGLATTSRAQGETSDWVSLQQYSQAGVPAYVNLTSDGFYEQNTDETDVNDTTEWWPIFLDPGELTFDINGSLLSPFNSMPFSATVTSDSSLPLSSMVVDLTSSTQYGAPFSVLSQSQDGAPEGDLMGLDIGADGLVSANYSNGTQKSLGKIVLANFASPSGLRQMGDARYLASTASGSAKIGEAGSSGFGSIRAGAIERSNVDLTQELVDLITAQRNFQANAKAIETSNTLTQAIIQIRG